MIEGTKERVFKNLKNYKAPEDVELTATQKRAFKILNAKPKKVMAKKHKKTKSQLDGERLILMLKAKAILKRKKEKEALSRVDRKGYKVSLCRYTNINF
jgi:hypothetical protein